MAEQNQDERDEFFDLPPAPAPAAETNKTGRRILAVFLALLVAVAGFLIGWFGHYYSLDEEIRTFLWAKSVAERNYYQPVDETELYERLYSLLDLDPYSELFSPEEYREYILSGEGQNVGIGISLIDEEAQGKTAPRFFLIVENSPASRAGLQKGMYLIGFGTDSEHLSSGDSGAFIEFLSAQKGQFVLRCGYERDGSDARDYTLARENYQAAYVYYRDSETSYHFRGAAAPVLTETAQPLDGLDGATAYIRLDEFSGDLSQEYNAAREFEECLSVMRDRGRRNLILDLRTNGGGYLDILGDIASHLMRNAGESPVVAVAKYRDGRTVAFQCADNDFDRYFSADSRVYLLADENTASASECLIGALVDYGTLSYSDIFLRQDENGVAKTYGKGIMQSHFESASGAAMKLTVATINWPVSGKCIHGVGVTPSDGAIPIPADLIAGKTDVMLQTVVARVCG